MGYNARIAIRRTKKQRNIDAGHLMCAYGDCYACICRVCNLRLCRFNTTLERCLHCMRISENAILDCDQFESRYRVHVFKVKRKALDRGRPSVRKMMYEIWKSGKWR